MLSGKGYYLLFEQLELKKQGYQYIGYDSCTVFVLVNYDWSAVGRKACTADSFVCVKRKHYMFFWAVDAS